MYSYVIDAEVEVEAKDEGMAFPFREGADYEPDLVEFGIKVQFARCRRVPTLDLSSTTQSEDPVDDRLAEIRRWVIYFGEAPLNAQERIMDDIFAVLFAPA